MLQRGENLRGSVLVNKGKTTQHTDTDIGRSVNFGEKNWRCLRLMPKENSWSLKEGSQQKYKHQELSLTEKKT